MPLTLPNLDDRSFTDLLVQTRSLIPRYAKNWTNHNPSDPGITLLELMVWLTEMVLYRLNQIHDRSYLNFLELLGVEPSGPLVEITFKIIINKDALSEDFFIDKGTPVAAVDSLTGDEIIFETLYPVSLNDGRWDEEESCWVFKTIAVNIIEIPNELLGISDGSPNQGFPIAMQPIFLDKENESSLSNPIISIEGKEIPNEEKTWNFKIDLLDSVSGDRVFTIKQLAGLVRFGDGDIHGEIPPKGAEIFCTYKRIGGIKGNVAKGTIINFKGKVIKSNENIIKIKGEINGEDNPEYSLEDPSIVKVFNEYPAIGGVDSETLDDLLEKGLRQLQERFRAVSDKDFERLVKQAVPEKLARVKVVFDRNLEPEEGPDIQEAHVSLIILPTTEYLLLDKTGYSSNDLINALEGHRTEILKHDILRHLDKRRLITTILHIVTPQFTQVSLDITVKAKPGVLLTPKTEAESLEYKIRKRIELFLSPYPDRDREDVGGWPFGRYIYRSELYQQIESIPEIDYVVQMLMNDNNANPSISVAEYNLVFLRSLDITIT